jgi:hypothetical protein
MSLTFIVIVQKGVCVCVCVCVPTANPYRLVHKDVCAYC